MDTELEASDAIDQIDRADRAAALDLANDFPFSENSEEAEAEADAEKPDEAPAKTPPAKVEATDAGEGTAPRKRLADLAAEKRRERMEKDAQAKAEAKARDFDIERAEFERRQREFERREKQLEADPFEYLEKHRGWDRSQAAERLVAGQLRPESEQMRQVIEAQGAELKALRERYDTDTQTKAQAEQEARWHAHQEATYSAWDGLSGDREKYPLTSRLPPMVRRQYGDHVANLLAEAYPGRRFSQEEIATEVENDLAGDEPAGAPSSGGRVETAGANGAGKQRPPDTLTNDLASQTAGSDRAELDPSYLRKQAMREAAKMKW